MTDKEILKQMLDKADIQYQEREDMRYCDTNYIKIHNEYIDDDDLVFTFYFNNDNSLSFTANTHNDNEDQSIRRNFKIRETMTDKEILTQMLEKAKIEYKVSTMPDNKIILDLSEYVIYSFDESWNLKNIEIGY